MYLCLSLGFEGKYRVIEGGQRTLDGLQENVYRAIQQQRGAFEQELSPHWRTEEKPRQTLRNYIPLWVVAALAAVLLLASYLVFSYFINQSSAPVFKTLATIGREAPPPQAEAVIASPPPAPPTGTSPWPGPRRWRRYSERTPVVPGRSPRRVGRTANPWCPTTPRSIGR